MQTAKLVNATNGKAAKIAAALTAAPTVATMPTLPPATMQTLGTPPATGAPLPNVLLVFVAPTLSGGDFMYEVGFYDHGVFYFMHNGMPATSINTGFGQMPAHVVGWLPLPSGITNWPFKPKICNPFNFA